MGVNFKDLVEGEVLTLEDLKNRVIAVDAMNSLYQFLSSIRQADGTPLMDSRERVTSHLSGLLYRTIRLMQANIKPVYVFDGKPPALKLREIERRREIKEEAKVEWKRALEDRRIDDAKKYAMRTSKLTKDMIKDSKDLLSYMGVPYIEAPSEGEAQCSHICRKGDAWAVGSQDYDALLLGAPRIIRGLTLSGTLELSLVQLEKTLEALGVTREGLVDMAILVGTDFNEGVKGIGPKKALKAVREGRMKEYTGQIEDYEEVRGLFLSPDVSDDYKITWGRPKREKLMALLCAEHDFSENRVANAANNLEKTMADFSQTNLSSWF